MPLYILAALAARSPVLAVPSVRMMLIVHVAAGAVGIISGFVALFTLKGGRLHRRSGMLFVYVLLTMTVTGAVIATLEGVALSVIAALLTAYLVITALATVRPSIARWRGLGFGAMLVGLTIGLASVTLGIRAATIGKATAPMFFIFGIVALLAAISDVRMLRSGGVRGAARLARHLWRMCFALFIATSSFFLGQADKFPERFRIPLLLAIPVLVPLTMMVYWLWRVRTGRTALPAR